MTHDFVGGGIGPLLGLAVAGDLEEEASPTGYRSLRTHHQTATLQADDRSIASSEAMDRYASGEDAALSEVYDALAPRLLAYFVRKTRNRTLADDLTQQTFLNMHLARASFRVGAQVTPWAFAIGHRLLVDECRRRRVRGDGEVLSSGTEDTASDAELTSRNRPDHIAESSEQLQQLAKALVGLPAAQRDAFELVRLDGLSMAEAAAVTGTTVNAMKLRASRAYEALRRVLEGDEG